MNKNAIVYFSLIMVKPNPCPVPPYQRDSFWEEVFRFNNGIITIPHKKAGYIVSCGCGSGKTTNIRNLIVRKQDEGILYCVDTKAELDKMESCLVNMGIAPYDILKIHGEVDKKVLADYQKKPEVVVTKKILLITHCRLFMDLIHLFLIYNPTSKVTGFNGDFEELMKRDDLRQWILLDETPLMFKPFIQIRHSLLGYFIGKTRPQIEKNYNLYIQGTKEDPFKYSTGINEWKKDLVLNLIPQYVPKWKCIDKKKELSINFYTSHLIQDYINTHVIVFEGAGDILLRSSRMLQLLDLPEKYNTKVDFSQFDFHLKRKETKPYLDDSIGKLAEIIIEHSGKVLVVVWKSIGKDTDEEDSGESEFRDQVNGLLLKEGCPSDKFEVTYYGAANTKSTNEFRDYTGIILFGNWSINNNKVAQINEAYMTSTSPDDQKLWYFVQLICRTAIRNHSGGEIKVWYSSDFSSKFIQRLDVYLNKNTLTGKEGLAKGTWIDKMVEMKIQDNIRKQIIRINKSDPKIEDCILIGRPYTIKYSLDELFELFPKSKKLRRKYEPLVNNLAKLGITLEID